MSLSPEKLGWCAGEMLWIQTLNILEGFRNVLQVLPGWEEIPFAPGESGGAVVVGTQAFQ